jgi:hypothetical protein
VTQCTQKKLFQKNRIFRDKTLREKAVINDFCATSYTLLVLIFFHINFVMGFAILIFNIDFGIDFNPDPCENIAPAIPS